jgi:hypothetical protein
MLAFFVIKSKLEYPLALHQNLAKKPCEPLIPILPAANLVGVPEAGKPVDRRKQHWGRAPHLVTDGARSTASLRRGAPCCARCVATDTGAGGQAFQNYPFVSTFCAASAPGVPKAGSQFSPNCDKLNRQTHEFKNAVTYRKQTTATRSNRQNFHFCPPTFLATFQSDAGSIVTPRIPRT